MLSLETYHKKLQILRNLLDMNYYTFGFRDGEYVLYLGDITQLLYKKLAELLDRYYMNIDSVMQVGGITLNDRYYSITIEIPPLSEKYIHQIMEEFSFVEV